MEQVLECLQRLQRPLGAAFLVARQAPEALFLEAKGLEVCQSVRATCRVPIFVVFDSMPSWQEAVEAFDHGCSDILVKPIETKLLQKKVSGSFGVVFAGLSSCLRPFEAV